MSERAAWLLGSFVVSLLIVMGIAWALMPMVAGERTIDAVVNEWAAK